MKLALKKYYGPMMMLLAAVCFSTGGLLHKIIPWSPLAINGTRNIIAAIVIGIYLIIKKHKVMVNLTVILGAICMFGVTTLFTIANKMTTAGSAIVLQYTAPIWIIVLMAIFFGKKPKRVELVTIAIVLVGICCFFFDSLSTRYLLGNMAAIAAGLFYAGVFMLNEFEKGDALSSMFLGQLACGIVFTPFVTRETDFSISVIVAILVLGVVQVGVAYILFSEGTKYTQPVTASIIAAIEPILNPVLVAIFWGEKLGILSLVGAVIVILAVLLYNIRQN